MRSLEPRITCPQRAWGPQRSPISLSLSAPYYVVVAWLASTLLPLPLDSSRPSSVVSLHHHHHLPFSPTRLHCSTPLSTQLTYSPRNRAIKASTHGGRLDEIDPPSRIDRSEMMMDSAEHHKVIAITPAAQAPAAEAGRPCCVECRTTATPMWRGGPTGPRSLCNACGIRYRKKRRQELGLDTIKKPQQNQLQPQPQPQQQQRQHQDHSHSPATSSAVVKDNNKSSSLQVVKKRRVLMGVEEAAILLMALSSSSRSTLLHG